MAGKASIATWALVRDTFREAFARKIFWGFFGCSTMVVLFFLFLMKIDVVEGALATVSLFGNELPARDVIRLVHEVQGGLAAFLFGFDFFWRFSLQRGWIPSIFEPGRIELLLSKPVARYHILLGRYLGKPVGKFAFNMLYLVTPVWLYSRDQDQYLDRPIFLLDPADDLRVRRTAYDRGGDLSAVRIGRAGDHGDICCDDSGSSRGAEVDTRAPVDVGVVAQCGERAVLHASQNMGPGPNCQKTGDGHACRRLDAGVEFGAFRHGNAESRIVLVRQAELLMKTSLAAISLLILGCSSAQMGGTRVDSALAALVPADTIVLAGVRTSEPPDYSSLH